MKRGYHIGIQILLWGLVWWLMSTNHRDFWVFATKNGPAFIFQIAGIIIASYVLIPRLLQQKKYTIFAIVSIVLVVGFAYVSGRLMLPKLPIAEMGPRLFPPGRPKPPSPFTIHLMFILVSYILNVLVETFVQARKRDNDLALQKMALVESELKLLKMQINPHFLFNALNNIYSLSVTNSEKTQESISTLSDMLRYVIYDCDRKYVPLEKEIQYIEDYIALFKLKSSKSFNIETELSAVNGKSLVAPMLFIPFVENAFKHSGIEKGGTAFVRISLTSNNEGIVFSVENSIPNKSTETDPVGGIGLENVKKRLELLYPGRYVLNIDKNSSFRVALSIQTNE